MSQVRPELTETSPQLTDYSDVTRFGPAFAHDFRSLCTVVLGNAQLIADELGEGSELLPLVRDILDAGERAVGLTRHLDAICRAPEPACDGAEIELREAVNSCDGILRAIAGRGVQVEIRVGPDPLPVTFDPIHLSQVLINLVSNARAAVAGNGEVVVDLSASQGMACICVSDDGDGIPDDALPRIFEPYFSTREAGTGLGLATVAALVRQSGGWVTAENNRVSGARFCAFLPIRDEHPVSSPPILFSSRPG
jgi:two-component system cell cycle sensor histidine kinase/response regulator CckA